MASTPQPTGLEAVYLAHRDKLTRFLRARGAGAAAEDLVQELWLRIGSAATGPIVDPLGYLYRAANNLMLNAHRSSVRESVRDEAWSDVYHAEHAHAADASLVARQEINLARARLAECGPRVQQVFMLFRVDGVSQRDIAERLGVSLSAVEKDVQRAYRAIAALRHEGELVLEKQS